MPIPTLAHCFRTISSAALDLLRLAWLTAYSRRALAAENLFLRKQLALFQERKVKPRRATASTRWTMATLSRLFPWQPALVIVKADTLVRWHRKGDSGCSGVGSPNQQEGPQYPRNCGA